MAIRIIIGKPRTGKTYYAVKHLAETYFYRTGNGWWRRKKEYKNLRIVSNIDDLQLPHESLDKWITGAGGQEKLFSLEYQKKIHQKYPQVVYLIDEAQFLFPSNYRNNATNNWLEYHGHLGQDIYLLTHAWTSLPRHFYNLAELQLEALSRTKSLFMGRDLWYNVCEAGEILDKKWMFKRQWVFDLYTSQESKEVERAGNPFIKYVFVLLIALGLAVWNGYRTIYKDRIAAVPPAPPPQERSLPSDGFSAGDRAALSGFSVGDMSWQSVNVVRTWQGDRVVELFVVDNIFFLPFEFPYEVKRRGRNVYAYMPRPEPDKSEIERAAVPSFSFDPSYKDDCPTCPK